MTTVPDMICTLCKEPINAGAAKCVKCGGYQGKWFFLNLGAPTIGMLVALISVISLSVALLAPLFKRQASEVRVSFQFFQNGTVYFVASNGGTRPGSIGEAWLDLKVSGKPERYYLTEPSGNRLVGPGSSRNFSFAIPCETTYPNVHYQRSEKFGAYPLKESELAVSVVQFDGTKKVQRFPLDDLPGLRAVVDKRAQCVIAKLGDDPDAERDAVTQKPQH